MATIVAQNFTSNFVENNSNSQNRISSTKVSQFDSINLNREQQDNILELWATISHSLWWIVVFVSVLSVPILCQALGLTLRRYKKTNYSYFFITMIILNVVMLLSILFDLMSDSLLKLKGNFTCKLTAFVTNVTSCYSNWLWVMMFVKRFVHIFYPMQYVKANKRFTLFCILYDTRQLIFLTGIMSVGTQLWAPFLMREILVYSAKGVVEGSYCGPDSTLVNKKLFKWIAVVESAWTYAIPFLITLLTDIGVLFFSRESKKFAFVILLQFLQIVLLFRKNSIPFTTVCAEDVCNNSRIIRSNCNSKVSNNCLNLSNSTSRQKKEYNDMTNESHLNLLLDALPAKNAMPNVLNNKNTTLNALNNKKKNRQICKKETKNLIGMSPENSVKKSCFSQQNNICFKPHSDFSSALKIQSEDLLRACQRRRQNAIRRCLMLATIQLFLNLPNYVLQLVDEFTSLRQTSRMFAVFYLYADAVFYLLYLSQYPMMAVYVRWFHSNINLHNNSSASAPNLLAKKNKNMAFWYKFFKLKKLSFNSN